MQSWRVAVGAGAPVLIVDCTESERTIWLRNDTTGNIYIGGSTVTDATGFELPGTSTFPTEIKVPQGHSLWAIRQNGNGELHVLAS